MVSRGGTAIHYLYGYVPPNGVVIFKLLVQNGVSISEAFSRTGCNISNARKLQFCKQPFEIHFKDRLLLKIRFNKLTSKLLYSCCTLERSIKNWPISRTGYPFQEKFLKRGANLESRAAHTHPKKTQVPPPVWSPKNCIETP